MKYYKKYPYLNAIPSVGFKEVENSIYYHILSEITVGDSTYLKIESCYRGGSIFTYRGCFNNIVDPGILEYHQQTHGESVMRIEFNSEDLTFFYTVYINGIFVESHCDTLNPDFSVKKNYSFGKHYQLVEVREYEYYEYGEEKSLKIFFPELWHIDFDEY